MLNAHTIIAAQDIDGYRRRLMDLARNASSIELLNLFSSNGIAITERAETLVRDDGMRLVVSLQKAARSGITSSQ